MIQQPTKPSNQMGLKLDPPMSGEKTMIEARDWIEKHPEAWEAFCNSAQYQNLNGGVDASPDICAAAVRSDGKTSLKNALKPALARIAMEENPKLHFRIAKSKCDPYTEAVL